MLPTLDSLATGRPLQIFAELTSTCRSPSSCGAEPPPPTSHTVAAFPVAAAQVRHWLAAHLPDGQVVPANSNAAAARTMWPRAGPMRG